MALTNICSLCKTPFTSLLIPRNEAAKDVGQQLQKHLLSEHETEFNKFCHETLGQITMLASGLAVINHFVEFEPDDLTSIEEHEKNVDELMGLMGFEFEDNEDEEKESNEKEETEETEQKAD